jgi:hypothetical protein
MPGHLARFKDLIVEYMIMVKQVLKPSRAMVCTRQTFAAKNACTLESIITLFEIVPTKNWMGNYKGSHQEELQGHCNLHQWKLQVLG